MTSARVAARRRHWAALVVGSVLLLVLSGCSLDDVPNQIAIPDPASDSGDRIFHLWQATWVALWVDRALHVGTHLGAAVLVPAPHAMSDVPKQTRYNLPIEVMYTDHATHRRAGLRVATERDDSRSSPRSRTTRTSPSTSSDTSGTGASTTLEQDVYEVGLAG